jgi:phospholipase/carboxylesterase
MRDDRLGGLRVRIAGGTDGQGGGQGPVVILLHGFGAPGDDLVSLAEALDVPAGTRFLFPEGPLSLNFGFGESRAWWLIDMARIQEDRAAGRIRDLSNEIPRGLAPARERLLSLWEDVKRHFKADPQRTIIGGFSQGAMLACDLLLHTYDHFAGLVQLSGNLLAMQEWGPLLHKRKGLPIFQSHGTQDEILPYAGAERLRDELQRAGLAVEWHSFRGSHEIPDVVMDRLGSFITRMVNRR